MDWKRVAIWSLLTIASAIAIGTVSAQVFASGWAMVASIFISSTFWYWLLGRRLHHRRVLHVLLVFAIVEILDRSIPLLLGAPLHYALSDWASSAYHFGAAMLGLALARLSSNKSFKPNPLRGSA